MEPSERIWRPDPPGLPPPPDTHDEASLGAPQHDVCDSFAPTDYPTPENVRIPDTDEATPADTDDRTTGTPVESKPEPPHTDVDVPDRGDSDPTRRNNDAVTAPEQQGKPEPADTTELQRAIKYYDTGEQAEEDRKPPKGTVAENASQGKEMIFSVRNEGTCPQIVHSPELSAKAVRSVPAEAESETPETTADERTSAEHIPDTATSKETPDADTTSEKSREQGSTEVELTYWASLVPVKLQSPKKEDPTKPDTAKAKDRSGNPAVNQSSTNHQSQPKGIDIPALFDKGQYAINLHAQGVSAEDYQDVIGEIEEAQGDAQTKRSLAALAEDLENVKDTVSQGRLAGLVHLGVTIGAPSREELAEKINIATAALPAENRVWKIIAHGESEDEVLQAARNDLRGYTTAHELADMITYPNRELVGYYNGKADARLAVNCVLEPGEKPVKYGSVLNPLRPDEVVGDLVTSEREAAEHIGLVGISGRGKSTGLLALIEGFYEATNGRVPFLLVDPKTQGLGKRAHHRLKERGFNVPGRIITPGSSAYRATLEMLDPRKSSPRDVIEELVDAFMVSMGQLDPESARPLERYVTQGVRHAFIKNGFDLEADESAYPGIAQHPGTAEIGIGVIESLQKGRFKDPYAQRVADWAVGQYDKQLVNGKLGYLLDTRFGQAMDTDPMLEPGALTEFNGSKLGGEVANTMAAYALLKQLIRRIELRGRQTEGLELGIAIDECGLFPDSPAGEKMALLLTYLRHLGISIIWATQDGIYKFHHHAISNTGTLISYATPNPDDQKVVISKTSLDDLPMLPSLPRGTALVIKPGVDAPLLARFPNPVVDTNQPDTTTDGMDLVDTKKYGRPVVATDLVKALSVHERVREMAVLSGVIELNAFALATGHVVKDGKGGLTLPFSTSTDFQNRVAEVNPSIREVATINYIDQAISRRYAFLLRPDNKETAGAYLRNHILPPGDSNESSIQMPEVSILEALPPTAKFEILKHTLAEKMLAEKHPESDTWEDALGVALVGTKANMQLLGAKGLRSTITHELEERMRNAIDAGQPSTPSAIKSLIQPIGVIANGEVEYFDDVTRSARAIAYETLEHNAYVEISRLVGGSADSDEEKKVHDALEKKLAAEGLKMPFWPTTIATPDAIGLSTIIKKLEKHVKDYREIAPVPEDLHTVAEMLGVTGLRGDTAAKMYECIEQLQLAEKQRFQRKTATPIVYAADDMFARDPKGHTILDNIIAALIAMDGDKSKLRQEAEEAFKDGQPEGDHLASRLARENKSLDQSTAWRDTFLKYFVNNPDVIMSEADKLWLADQLLGHLKMVQDTVAQRKATASPQAVEDVA